MTTSLPDIEQRLEDVGYRLTSERHAVLEYVDASSDPFSAEDAVRALPDVGRATVFRTLKLLLDLDIICRIIGEDGGITYEISRKGHHHHLICVRCGRVQDFGACNVPQMVEDIARSADFVIEGHRLEIFGHCGSCRAEAAT